MLPIAIIGFVLGVDILTKLWVNDNLPLMLSYSEYPYGGIGVFENWAGIQFSISHLTNRGAAWGVLTDYQEALLWVRIALIGGLILYAAFWNRHPSWRAPLALVIAGATGNVIDYYLYGHVVDMLHVVLWGYDFPVFNVADSAVSVGVFWLIIVTSFQQQEGQASR